MFRIQDWANLRRKLAVTLALLAAGLAPETARAVVVLVPDGGEEKASLLAEAHQAGLAYPWVVGLWSSGQDEAPLPATGSFIGFGQDGRTGYVLTAAHVLAIRDVQAKEARQPTGVQIVFGPALKSYRATNGLTVQADRGFVHPEFQAFLDASVPGRDGVKRPTSVVRNDLALLRFDLGPDGPGMLAARGIQPARLYDGQGFQTPLREAAIAGFGISGTTEDTVLNPCDLVHAGSTKVTYGTWRGITGFIHWSPLTPNAGYRDHLSNRFTCHAIRRTNYVDPVTQGIIPMESHPHHQAFGTLGDSGGPLVLSTRRGPELAGVYSYLGNEHLSSYFTGAPAGLFHFQYWVPVKDHLPWIRKIMTAKDGMPPEPREIRYLGGPVDLASWRLFRDMEPQLASEISDAKAGGEREPGTTSSPKGTIQEESKGPSMLAVEDEGEDPPPDSPMAGTGRKRKAEALSGFSFVERGHPPRKRARTGADGGGIQ